eukprot:5859931-Alexandrium_andersonii.AAC.1
MGGWSASAGGAAQPASDPLQSPWAGVSWGQGWADDLHGQGRPQECSVDLRVWSDTYAVLDLEAQPRATAFGSRRHAATHWA